MLQKASWPQRREVCHGFIVGSFASDWRDECLGLGNGGAVSVRFQPGNGSINELKSLRLKPVF